jgi:phage terminase Nu1 subunit (DNA packaging protein)
LKATALDLCAWYSVDRRTITKWLSADPPVPSTVEKKVRAFESSAVARWYADRAARNAIAERDRTTPSNITELRARRDLAQTRLLEIDLALREGELISMEAHQQVAEDACNRMRAVLINIPSTHTLALERAGVSAAAAQKVLEEIAEDITTALRGTAEEMLADVLADDRARELTPCV